MGSQVLWTPNEGITRRPEFEFRTVSFHNLRTECSTGREKDGAAGWNAGTRSGGGSYLGAGIEDNSGVACFETTKKPEATGAPSMKQLPHISKGES